MITALSSGSVSVHVIVTGSPSVTVILLDGPVKFREGGVFAGVPLTTTLSTHTPESPDGTTLPSLKKRNRISTLLSPQYGAKLTEACLHELYPPVSFFHSVLPSMFTLNPSYCGSVFCQYLKVRVAEEKPERSTDRLM